MRIITFLVLFLICFSGYPQIKQTHRYEKPIKFSDHDFTIVPLKEDGLALIRGTDTYKSGRRNWEVVLLDTALSERWTLEFDIENQCKLLGNDRSPNFVHILFLKNEISGEMRLVTIQLDTREITKYEISPELNYKLTHFNRVGPNFIFGGVLNLEPCVLLFNPSIENLKVIPGFFQKNTRLIDMRVNHNQTFNTVILDNGSHDDRKVIFKTFDSSGKELLEYITAVDEEMTIQTGVSSILEREDLMVAGTMGKKNSKQTLAFYTLSINPFSIGKIEAVYFGELDHYLDYLKPKKANAIKAKTKVALEHGEIPSFTNYVLPHKILEHSKGFLLLAESYLAPARNDQSGYRYSPYTPAYYSPYGPYTYPTTRRYSQTQYGSTMVNPDEFKKVEIIAVNIDPSGKVIWDHSMKFDDIHMQTAGQAAECWIETDTVHLIYKKESELKTKSISLSTSESIELTQKISTLDPHVEIRSESREAGFVEHWLGNSFYVWGYQNIRSAGKGTKNRDVFYVNKIIIY